MAPSSSSSLLRRGRLPRPSRITSARSTAVLPRRPRFSRAFAFLVCVLGCLLVLLSWSVVVHTSPFEDWSTIWTQSGLLTGSTNPTLYRQVSTVEQLPKRDSDAPFCAAWSVNVDAWWKSHYQWEPVYQNTTHQCFDKIRSRQQLAIYGDLCNVQNGDCSNTQVFRKHLSKSGWGVDLSHAVDGLLYALDHKVPVELVVPNWPYARGVCRTEDLNCYVLPLRSCPPSPNFAAAPFQDKPPIHHYYSWRGFDQSPTTLYVLQYLMRGQTWLRHRAVQLAASVPIQSPCAAIHVRRGDVVLHGKFSRQYHPVKLYLDALKDTDVRNILLLTDDANAIGEATTLHQESFDWYYVDRPRHHGPSGGWENPIPSGDAAYEVVVLQASVLLAQKCNVLVHTKSNLADFIYSQMKYADPKTRRIDLDAHVLHDQVHSSKNRETVTISREYT